jgi:tol-pal system protein YbgF
MIARRLWWLGAGALLLSGCMVDPKEFDALRDQVRVQQKLISELKARQEEQGLRTDTLNNSFKILGDKAEENARRIDELQEHAGVRGEAPAAAPAPLAATAAAPAPEPPSRPAAAPAAAPAPAPAAPAPAAPAPQESILLTNRAPGGGQPAPPAEGELITAGPKADKLYATALDLFSKHRYEDATRRFEDFTIAYPDHKLAGNAQYWIGECYYSQSRFKEAAEEFAKVEKAYPGSQKVPAALYKRGLSLVALKRVDEAKGVFKQLQSKYPKTDEAAKAGERLSALEAAGQQPAAAGAR